METTEILQALPKLTIGDRLTIAETALRLIREEQPLLTGDQLKRQLAIAAVTAVSDYTPGSELVVFADLDGEDFYDDPEAHA